MPFQEDAEKIEWRIHLKSPPREVYRMLATDEGRARFWAESANEREGTIHFEFPDGMIWQGRVLEAKPPHRFSVDYFGHSTVIFDVREDGEGGTDLFLTARSPVPEDREEEIPGWISVLMALKAAVDFGVDLRNHDPTRTWDQGYADN
ncbi:MAG TPA: SRPBCC domain-containing protein [Thermoplasmata archaeon]|nr:SRPBCC domain-containing protein [Thermoplasmata archaeon]